MWPNPQKTADLVTFTEEILNGKLHFLCSHTLDNQWLHQYSNKSENCMQGAPSSLPRDERGSGLLVTVSVLDIMRNWTKCTIWQGVSALYFNNPPIILGQYWAHFSDLTRVWTYLGLGTESFIKEIFKIFLRENNNHIRKSQCLF